MAVVKCGLARARDRAIGDYWGIIGGWGIWGERCSLSRSKVNPRKESRNQTIFCFRPGLSVIISYLIPHISRL